MVCRKVQVERPSWSTSGGQSERGESEAVAPAGGSVVETVEGLGEVCFIIAIQEAVEVQERHLEEISIRVRLLWFCIHLRFPIGPQHYAFRQWFLPTITILILPFVGFGALLRHSV